MRKIFAAVSAAAAVLTLGSAAVAQAAVAQTAAQTVAHPNHPHATPACGANCFDLSSLELGRHMIQNAFIYHDTGVGGKVGQDVNLKTASNSHPNEDFTGAGAGTLADFCGSLISTTSYVCINFPSTFPVFESNWSPFGNQSGLCAGVAKANVNNEAVTLQNCGVDARTLWVGDLSHSTTVHGHAYTLWVNAADPNVTHPLVLTAGGPTGRPTHQLTVSRLNLLTGNTVPDWQDFTLEPGPTP